MKNLTFLIIGVQKAGTTALAAFIGQHPNICMASKKEVHLFDAPEYNSEWNSDQINTHYSKYFSHCRNEIVLGEATPLYLFRKEIIPELKKYNPNLKLIIILRDPVERAISHYTMDMEKGNENRSMLSAFITEIYRPNEERDIPSVNSSRRLRSYISRGLYVEQLQYVRKYFPDKQILIIENNELSNFHESTLRIVFDFLNVDSPVIPKPKRWNTGKYPGNKGWWCKWLLSQYFKYRNRHLKKILLEMGYDPDWRWT